VNVENKLIAMLPRADRISLLAVCETYELKLSVTVCEPHTPTRYVYFPMSGFISLVTLIDGHAGVEVGMVGSEGMVGAELALGVLASPTRALVQGSGLAHRIPANAFKRELADSAALRKLLGRYLYVRMSQLAASAACLRFHLIRPRLARWLLMSQDRAQSNHFHVTQEFLAYMLGVRRVGITSAASSLQRGGLIEYHRGEIAVTDRGGLELASCDCYATERRAYAKLLG
jgi:CRP-like cAMP-binding protein